VSRTTSTPRCQYVGQAVPTGQCVAQRVVRQLLGRDLARRFIRVLGCIRDLDVRLIPEGRPAHRQFREFGHVAVDRVDTRAAAATIQTGVDLLADGKALGIYPEGTRSPDGRLHKFHTGVARLALRSGAPVIPVGLIGTGRVLIAGDRCWHRSPGAVHFGPALGFSGRQGTNDQHRSAARS
jgi:hypothetical protein